MNHPAPLPIAEKVRRADYADAVAYRAMENLARTLLAEATAATQSGAEAHAATIYEQTVAVLAVPGWRRNEYVLAERILAVVPETLVGSNWARDAIRLMPAVLDRMDGLLRGKTLARDEFGERVIVDAEPKR